MNSHGKEFEKRIRNSWKACSHKHIRFRITEDGGERPADELVLLGEFGQFNMLIEMKSTQNSKFNFSQIKPHQYNSLKHFHKMSNHHLGLIFIEFCKTSTLVVLSVRQMHELISETGSMRLSIEEAISNKFIVLGCHQRNGKVTYPIDDICAAVSSLCL